MKNVKSASAVAGAKAGKGKMVDDRQVAVPAVKVERNSEKTWTHTSRIEIRGIGVSEGERFLEVAVGPKTALLNVDNIAAPNSAELKLLTRLGEPLIKAEAKREFIGRAHDAARAEPTFKVAKMTGYCCDGEFVFPEGLAPKGETNIRRYFDWRYTPYHRRLRREGSVKGWLELVELCRGKSRLVMGLCLALSGPVCGKFGDEPPGVQLVSKGGMGNTTIGRVVSTVWGGDRNPARKIGCGVSWNNTGINVEVIVGAFNHMFSYMDDMHNAGETELQAIHNAMNGQGRGRSTDDQRAEFCTPMLSSSNVSIVQIARDIRRPHPIIPLTDRLMELGLPMGCPYFFEGIKTKEEMRVYGNQLRKLARENFGLAGPEFVRRLAGWMKGDRNAIQAFVDERNEAYHDAAANVESSGDRDLGRISNKFATIYVTGCLAVRFKMLPFTEPEILEALLTCHRDHVAFIDQELGVTPLRSIAAQGAPQALVKAIPAQAPFELLKKAVNDNIRKRRFIDANVPEKQLRGKGVPEGYVLRKDGKPVQYWIPTERFMEIAGDEAQDEALKQELYRRGLLMTGKRGDRRNFTIKRTTPDGLRPYFVVLRQKARR